MLTLKSKFSDYLALISVKSPCANQITSFDGLVKKSSLAEMSIDKAFDILDKENQVSEIWIRWTFEKFGSQLGEDIRLRLLTKITNPMTAMRLYLDVDFLTEKEDAMLKKIFDGKLPTAEKEVQLGIVSRKKVTK